MTGRNEIDRQSKERKRLRREMLAKRTAMTPGEVRERSEKVLERLESLLTESGEPGTLMAYFPIRNEVDTTPLLKRLMLAEWTVCLPVTDNANKTIIPVETNDIEGMEPGEFGIPGPPAGSPGVDVDHIRWCLVPGIAFDRSGHRLGYGAGFYDRFLAQLDARCEKVGLAFDMQIVDKFESSAWDIPLSVLVSESEIIRFTSGGGRR